MEVFKNQFRILFVLMVFTLIVTGYTAFTSRTKNASNVSSISTELILNKEFPTTRDAFNQTNIDDGGFVYYTRMSPEDVMNFYRVEYKAKGYTERHILPVVPARYFMMVFDGDSSGKSIVIQSDDCGDGILKIMIWMSDI